MEAELILGPLGIILAVINNLTPTLAIYSRIKSGGLAQIPLSLLKLAHISQLFWLIYSVMVANPTLIIVNFITTVTSCFNLFLYVVNTESILDFLPKYVMFFASINLLSFYWVATHHIGVFCLILTIAASVAGLEPLKMAIKLKDPMQIDLPMAYSGMLSSAVWSLFGIIEKDINVFLSSSIGFVIGLLLIFTHFFIKYRFK